MGRGTTVLALFLAIFMVWMSGCADVSFGSQQLGDFGNTQEEKAAVDFFKAQYGNPATNSGPPRFLEPMVSTGLVNNTPVDKVTKFSKDTGSIWFWVFYDNFKKGDPLTLTWTYNGKDMLTQQKPAGGDFGRAFGEFLRPDKGWATGTHTITITGGGTSAAATFEIVDGRTETVPLPYAGQLTGSQSVAVVPTQQLLGPAGTCSSATTLCNSACVETASDPDNCGACGTKCTSPQVCVYGQCSDSCLPATGAWLKPAGVELKNCDRHCVDIMSDELNCGGCGQICTIGSTCETGRCPISQVKCAGIGWIPCAGGCVDSLSDVKNCGSCGIKCDTGVPCVDGKCLTSWIVVTTPKAGDTYYWNGTIPVEWNPKFSFGKDYPGVTIVVRSESDGMTVLAWNMVGNDGTFSLNTKEFTCDQKGTQQFHVEVSTNDDAYLGKSGTFTVRDLPFSKQVETKNEVITSVVPAISPFKPGVVEKPVGKLQRFTDLSWGPIIITNPSAGKGPTSIGSVIPITWNMGIAPANEVLYIDYYEENGAFGGNIASHIPNTGLFDWNTAPFNLKPGNYYIAMCTADACGKSDVFAMRQITGGGIQTVPLGFSWGTWPWHRTYNSCVPVEPFFTGTGLPYKDKMIVGYSNSAPGCNGLGSKVEQFFYRGIVVLDTSTLPANFQKVTITLREAGGVNVLGTTTSSFIPMLADIWVPTGPVGEWKAAPEMASLYSKVPPYGEGGNKVTYDNGVITVDITELAKEWQQNPDTNYGLMFQGPSEVKADNNDKRYTGYYIEAGAVPLGFYI